MADLTALKMRAAGLLPPGTGVGASDPKLDYPALDGEVARGLPHRQAEFRAGRAAARAAMAAAGLVPQAVPAGADRAPVWPASWTGSITHSDRLCLAAVAPLRLLAGLGLDLEPTLPLEDGLRQTVLRAEEEGADPLQAKLIFSAKEAAYKAQYRLSRQIFDFQVLSITLGDEHFTATFCLPVAPFHVGDQLRGRWCDVAGHFLCAVTL